VALTMAMMAGFSRTPRRAGAAPACLAWLLCCLCLVAPALASEPAWIEVPPVRQFADARLGVKLSDIESHLPAGHIYRDSDLVTWAHETTHGIHSRIRNQYARWHANGFYVLANRGITFTEPRCSKSAAARFIPAAWRDSTYGLYVAGQPAWDGEPLYVFDEWIAYTNGTEVGIELSERGLWRGGQRSETTENMLEFCVFAGAVIWAVHERDPSYAELAKLTQFTAWNVERCLRLADEAEKHPAFITARARGMRDSIRAAHAKPKPAPPLPMLIRLRRALPLLREASR
jgi:hypothetical protein